MDLEVCRSPSSYVERAEVARIGTPSALPRMESLEKRLEAALLKAGGESLLVHHRTSTAPLEAALLKAGGEDLLVHHRTSTASRSILPHAESRHTSSSSLRKALLLAFTVIPAVAKLVDGHHVCPDSTCGVGEFLLSFMSTPRLERRGGGTQRKCGGWMHWTCGHCAGEEPVSHAGGPIVNMINLAMAQGSHIFTAALGSIAAVMVYLPTVLYAACTLGSAAMYARWLKRAGWRCPICCGLLVALGIQEIIEMATSGAWAGYD